MLLKIVSDAVWHHVIKWAFHNFVKERDALIFDGQAVQEVHFFNISLTVHLVTNSW